MAPMSNMNNAVVSVNGRSGGTAGTLSETAVMQARLIARSLNASFNAGGRDRDARGRFLSSGPGGTATGNVIALEARRANQAQIQQVAVLGEIKKQGKEQLDVLNNILKEQIKLGKVISKQVSSNVISSVSGVFGSLFRKLLGGAAFLGGGAMRGLGAVGSMGRAAVTGVLGAGRAVVGAVPFVASAAARAGSLAAKNLGVVAGALGAMISSSAGSMLAKFGPKLLAGARLLPGIGAVITGLAAAYQGLSGWNRAAEMLGRDLDPSEWRGRIAGAVGGIIGSIPFFDEAKVAKWVDDALGGAGDLMAKAKDKFMSFVQAPVDALAKMSSSVREYVSEGLASAQAKIADFISTDFVGIAASVKDWMGGVVSKITEGFRNFFSYINPFKGSFGGDSSDVAPSPAVSKLRSPGLPAQMNEVAAAATTAGITGATSFVSPSSLSRAQAAAYDAVEMGAQDGIFKGLQKFFGGAGGGGGATTSALPDPTRSGTGAPTGGGGGGLGPSPGAGGGSSGVPSVQGQVPSGWKMPMDPRGLAGRAKDLGAAIMSGDKGAIARELSRGQLNYKTQPGSHNGDGLWGGSQNPLQGGAGNGMPSPGSMGGGLRVSPPGGGGGSGYNPGGEPGGMGGVGPAGPGPSPGFTPGAPGTPGARIGGGTGGASGGIGMSGGPTNESIQREMQDPNIRARLAALTHREIGSSGTMEDSQKFMETVRNRAMARGKSLNEIMQPGYYPGKSFSPVDSKTLQRYDGAMNEVAGGSNKANFATDNASDEPGNPVKSNRIRKGVGPDSGFGNFSSAGPSGELFYTDTQYRSWAEGQRKAAQQRAAAGGSSERMAFDTDNNYSKGQVDSLVAQARAQGIDPSKVTIGYNPQNPGMAETEAAITAAGAKKHMYFGGPGDPSWRPKEGSAGYTNDKYLADMAKHGGWDKYMENHLIKSNPSSYEIDTMDTMSRDKRMGFLREHFGRLDAAGNTSKWMPKNAKPEDMAAYMADPVIAKRLQLDKGADGSVMPRSIRESDTPGSVGSITTRDTKNYKTDGLVGVGDAAQAQSAALAPSLTQPKMNNSFFPVPSVNPDNVPRSGGSANSREHMGPRAGGRHAGWDIAANTGEKVVANQDGRIIRAGSGQGYGSVIDVQYADGTVHRMAHLGNTDKGGNVQPFAGELRPGQEVKAGQHLGNVGYSGNAGREFPHAHYEVFKDKNTYDKAQGVSSREGAAMRMNPREYFEKQAGPARGTPSGGIAESPGGGGPTPMNQRGITSMMPRQQPMVDPQAGMNAGTINPGGAMGGVAMPSNPSGSVTQTTPEAATGGGEVNQASPPPPDPAEAASTPPDRGGSSGDQAGLGFGVNDIRNTDTAELLLVNQSMII